jgi:RecJ-like exonuclease
MSVGGDYVGREPCPQCTKIGYQRMIGKKEGNIEVSQDAVKKESAMKVLDRIMKKTREEKSLKIIYCTKCKGQRFVHERDEKGTYLGQEPCPDCYGTGRDYNAMASELTEKYVIDGMKKGCSPEEAWELCIKSCFTPDLI